MAPDRPTLLVRLDDSPLGPDVVAALERAFEVRTEAPPPAGEAATATPADSDAIISLEPTVGGHVAVDVLQCAAEGAGIWIAPEGPAAADELSGMAWMSRRLADRPEAVQRLFARTCRMAAEEIELAGGPGLDPRRRTARKYGFAADDGHYECVVSVLRAGDRGRRVDAVLGLLWETTASQRLQSRIDQIDAAGAELLRIDTESISRLDVRQRLQGLEQKIVRSLTEVLHFDAFEVRLVDRESNQLELVINRGLSPLKIGEVIHVGERGNGICGYVAATGRPYLCRDAREDLLYQDGLDDAQSSLTVPLRLLDDRVLGVLNVESRDPGAFSEEDLRFAELYGRYIAMAMHILDLLVVERYTTNTQLGEIVRSELGGPLEEISRRLEALMDAVQAPAAREEADRLAALIGSLRRRVEQGVTGPSSLIGAEQAIARTGEPDPVLVGVRILLADNEDLVRDAIRELLASQGCVVTACGGGSETIARIEAMPPGPPAYDLVISDIRMPDRNGYEVFRAALAVAPTLPVLLMTGFGYDPHHSIVRASEEGLDGFLFKPLRAPVLLEAIRNALAAADGPDAEPRSGSPGR